MKDIIEGVVGGFIIAGIFVGSLITLILLYGVPYVWNIVRPILHDWTR